MKKEFSVMPGTSGTHRKHIAEPVPDCSVAELNLNAYMDGVLPVTERRALELRLATDSVMRSKLAELDQIRSLVRLAYGAIGTE